MRVRAFGKEISNFDGLLQSYGESEFASPQRSTIPLLEYWRDTEVALNRFRKHLSTDLAAPVLDFEFKVSPVRGRGKASFSDLAIKTSDELVAIEAKSLEPPYPTCTAWLGDTPSDNKQKVLGGWLQLINERIEAELDISDVARLPYQLVHRTASACSSRNHRATVVYHVFDPKHASYYSEVLEALSSILAGRVRLLLLVSEISFSPAYAELVERFNAGSREMVDQVLRALRHGPIGAFDREDLTQFGAELTDRCES